jgi:sporulation protein YlmC with PRC-barrel domain
MKETDDKIVIFGHGDNRFDIPKSRIVAVGRNVILDMIFQKSSTIKLIECSSTNRRTSRDIGQ